MKKIISFLKTDVKIINSYFLLLVILIILICVGYSSYALFSFSKTSTNIIEGTVGEIKKSGVDTLIKLTNNKDDSGLYTITHEADSTLQIGNTSSITEYRYRGASPKNYVTFNNEVWRIIGVFPTDDGTGKIENRIKLIRNESIGNKFWNTNKSSSNNWTTASLKTELNGTYLTGLTSVSQSMISSANFYLGGYNKGLTIEKDVMYQYERKTSGSTYYYGTNPTFWVGKVALMYVSDYGYAASEKCSQTLYYYNDTTCTNNNWLFGKNSKWVLAHYAESSSSVYFVSKTGGVGGNIVYVIDSGVHPTLYLTSSVKITGGTGTSSDPYTLGL